MKDWSDLEEKYQEMREKDPASAEDFKKKMTERFQKTVQALEEESQAEKRQLQVSTEYLFFFLRFLCIWYYNSSIRSLCLNLSLSLKMHF